MATDFKYASQSDLNRYVGDIVADADSKRQVFGWSQSVNYVDISGTTLQLHFAHNAGFIDNLFLDGAEINKISFSTTKVTEVASAINPNETTFTLDSVNNVSANDIIKIDNEYIRLTAVSSDGSNTVTTTLANRGLFNTASQHHVQDSHVFKIIDNDGDVGQGTSAGLDALGFVYDDQLDLCILIAKDTDPNDFIIEAGFDNSTYYDQMLVDASMELNNLLDARYPTPLPKYDQYDGNTTHSASTTEYDAIIIKMTCYIAASNALRTIGETEKADYYYDLVTNAEKTGMADRLNVGEFKLAFEVDSHDDKGKVRNISKAGTMDIVETAGEWYGEKYDVVRITCTTGGAYGTAIVKAETYGNDALFGTTTENIKVTGGLQEIVNGLYVRFQGASMNLDTTPDQWEVTVTGSDRKLTNAQTGAIDLTRRGYSV